MEFKNDKLGVTFFVPDKITVRQQLAYVSSEVFARGKDFLERYWLGAVGVMYDWQCSLIPDPETLDLDKTTDPRIAEIITWAGMEVRKFMNSLDEVPKN